MVQACRAVAICRRLWLIESFCGVAGDGVGEPQAGAKDSRRHC